ncbi:MAG TPA: GrdX family protein [Clostridia bacterium]|nr:GrdX family protein [Clostridia bacterium]
MLTSSFLVLTNNPLVAESLSERFAIEFFDGASDRDVLLNVRDLVHLGHRVLTAPLSGSVKPWETPYRSVMVTAHRDEGIDVFSLDIIERALAVIEKSKDRPRTYTPSILYDFQVIDLSLIESVLPSLEATGRP